MDKVRVAVIGIGNMGTHHARYLAEGRIPNAELTAVCDIRRDRLEWVRDNLGEHIRLFDNPEQLYESKCFDGIIIAVPHYQHPPLAIKAFEMGYHVLTEKPAGVYTRQVREMNQAAAKYSKIFGIMYNNRTKPVFKKAKDLIDTGELGEIRRTIIIKTNWYRSQSYYDSGTWRATWKGEGGGVLLNQCPHDLDLWQWLCGVPKRVRAFCHYGKYRNIEVEDDVTAYVEYENNATGVFITTTGEAPGTDRFEIDGNRGKLVIEDDQLMFYRLRVPEDQFNREYKGGFGSPECWECQVPVGGKADQHEGITADWVNSIKDGTGLFVPGEEGIKGLEISNAMHLSDWINDWVSIPVDEDLFFNMLNERIQKSSFNKQEKTIVNADMTDTF